MGEVLVGHQEHHAELVSGQVHELSDSEASLLSGESVLLLSKTQIALEDLETHITLALVSIAFVEVALEITPCDGIREEVKFSSHNGGEQNHDE